MVLLDLAYPHPLLLGRAPRCSAACKQSKSVIEVDEEVLRDRALAATRPGDLSLVPLAAESRALAIPLADFEKSIAKVRAQVRAHRWQQRTRRRDHAQALVEWQRGEPGATVCSAITSAIPSLECDSHCLLPRPMGADLVWVGVASPAAELVPRMVALKHDGEQSEVCKMAFKRWVERHMTMMHKDQTPLLEPKPAKGRSKPKPACSEVHHCLCGEHGDLLWNTHQRVLTTLRKYLKHKPTRELMQEGFIVVNITAMTEDSLDDFNSGDIGPDDFSIDVLDPAGYAHISLLYENPLRPTFRCHCLKFCVATT